MSIEYAAPRGWVGTPEIIDPFKASIVSLSSYGVALCNPPVGELACYVDAAGGLVGFAVQTVAGFEMAPPDGAIEMSAPVAAALLSVLAAGR
jgi:hypothetical protein